MINMFVHITPSHFLILSMVLFSIGALGMLFSRNAFVMMMSIEIMLNAANISVITFARMHGDMGGHILAIIAIAIAAAEASVGIAMILTVFRTHGSVDLDVLTNLNIRCRSIGFHFSRFSVLLLISLAEDASRIKRHIRLLSVH